MAENESQEFWTALRDAWVEVQSWDESKRQCTIDIFADAPCPPAEERAATPPARAVPEPRRTGSRRPAVVQP